MAIRRMRVAQVLEATVGGTRTHLNLLLSHIDRAKFDVTLICSTSRSRQFVDDIGRLRTGGITVRVIDMVRSLHPWKDALGSWQLFRFLRRGHFDLVHTHSSKAGALGRLAAHLAGVPLIVHTPHVFAFQQDVNRFMSWLYVLFERLAGRWTNLMICVSHEERRIAIANRLVPSTSACVIHNGIDLGTADRERQREQSFKTELDYAADDFIVGCVADLRPQKGLEYLIRAAKRVLHDHPTVKFLIVGSGKLIHKLKRLSSINGVHDNFKFVTAGSEPIWKYYEIMDVFVLPSLWEGLPYAVLEAMAMSKPIVATAVTGTRELVVPNESGLLVSARDETALAEAIITLIEAPELRNSIGANARLRVETCFRIENKVRELEMIYEVLQCGARL